MKDKSDTNTSAIQPSGDTDLSAPGGVKSAPRTTREIVMAAMSVRSATRDINDAINSITNLEELEKASWNIFDDMPEATENKALITDARKNRNKASKALEAELIAKQKLIYDDIHEELALITGVETDNARVLKENDEYRGLIAQQFTEEDICSVESDDTLQRLGMLTPDENGNLVFSFPRDTFPPHIREKWDHYIDIVARYAMAEIDRENGHDVADLIAQLNAIRTQAHNHLASVIKEFLYLDAWDFEKCRNLVIKMRDARLPTLETAEKEVTAVEIKRIILIARGLGRMSLDKI